MRFVVDGMLGGLARWLRMLGHTVIYSSHADDSGLLDLAYSQRMILLTRDEELHRRALAKNIPSVLVTGDEEEERLAQLATALQMPLDINMAETKCPECGRDLRETSKEEVSLLVPAASLELYEQFWMCRNPDCGKVYWMGSHWKQIKQTLAAAKELAEHRGWPQMVDVEEGAMLVKTARAAIESYLSSMGQPPPSYSSPPLQQPRGVFVTLLDRSRGNALRGCIGSPIPEKPLVLQVAESAVEAATMDPRFSPVSLKELRGRIIIEVTVLTSAEEINVRNPLESRDMIIVGRDGLMVNGMGRKGLLLPQVAVDEGFDSEEFLSQCCIKAGLLPDAWLTGRVRVSRFQGQIFSENKPGGTVSERRLARD